MNDQSDLARGWLQKADSDLATAKLILSGTGPYDTACFHAQQAIEKCLKAVLAYHLKPIPRTHNLEDLAEQAVQAATALAVKVDLDALSEITPFAVELRYDPAFWPDRETASEALATAERVRSQIQEALPQDALP